MADKIRFAIIGVGEFGAKRAIYIMKNTSAELSYVVDVDKDKAKKISLISGAEVIDFEGLLHRSDFDIAIIATPNKWHAPLTLKLLDARKDVWCEKPMSTDINSARKMVEKSIHVGSILKVGSNTRYLPNVIRAEQVIRSDLVGEPIFFRGWVGNNGDHLLCKEWYKKREYVGGGTLIDNGVHLLDIIRYFMGEITRCYSCFCSNLRWFLNGLEDNCVAIYGLEKEYSLAIIHSSWTEKLGYMHFEIQGDAGFVNVDVHPTEALLIYNKADGGIVKEDYSDYPKKSYELELKAFIHDYKRGFHPKPTSYDGYRVVKIALLSYQATSKGPVITFDRSDRELYDRFNKVFEVR